VDRHRAHVRLQVPLARHRISQSSLWDTPPKAFAYDHDRWQVSWLAGRRFKPPSQGWNPQWQSWPSARRLQLRGQPRNFIHQDEHRIPFLYPLRDTTKNNGRIEAKLSQGACAFQP
jgi:hypothetical protein